MKILIILIYLSLTQTEDVLCDKNSMAIRMKSKSWISGDDFSTMIRLSYPRSQCCNIFMGHFTERTEHLFNQFIKTFPHEYAVDRNLWQCKAFLLLAEKEEEILFALKTVPVKIPTTEILIVVDQELNASSTVLQEQLYANSNVNVASPNGIWSLSENYLYPRKFERIQRYEEMIHKTSGIVDFKGRKIKALSYHQPPFVYLETALENDTHGRVAKPLTSYDPKIMDGVEIWLFLLIAERLNFTWSIERETGTRIFGSKINASYWDGGMIGRVFSGEVDMAFGGIWVKHDNFAFANLTESWYQVNLHFLVPRPRKLSSFWALTKPFSTKIWALVVLMILLESFYMSATAWIDPGVPKRFRSLIVTSAELIGRLVGTWNPRDTSKVKIMLCIWQIIGVIIVTAYSSSLAAHLANPEYEPRIDTYQQLVEADLIWGTPGDQPFGDVFDPTASYYSAIVKRFSKLTPQQRHEEIQKGRYAVLGTLSESVFFPEEFTSLEDLRTLRLMRQPLSKFYASFAVQPWLQGPVNLVIQWLRESGFANHHLKDVIRRRALTNFREVLIEYDRGDGTPRVLSLTPLGAGFAILLFGLSISTVVFFYEMKTATTRAAKK